MIIKQILKVRKMLDNVATILKGSETHVLVGIRPNTCSPLFLHSWPVQLLSFWRLSPTISEATVSTVFPFSHGYCYLCVMVSVISGIKIHTDFAIPREDLAVSKLYFTKGVLMQKQPECKNEPGNPVAA